MYEVTIKANCIEELYNDAVRLAERLGPVQTADAKPEQPEMWVDQPGDTPEPEKPRKKKPAADPEPEPEEQKKITLEELRAVLAEKTRSGQREKVKAVLESFGASKLTELDAAKYAACYEAIMGEEE